MQFSHQAVSGSSGGTTKVRAAYIVLGESQRPVQPADRSGTRLYAAFHSLHFWLNGLTQAQEQIAVVLPLSTVPAAVSRSTSVFGQEEEATSSHISVTQEASSLTTVLRGSTL